MSALDHRSRTAVQTFGVETVPDRERVLVRARGEIDLATAPAVETTIEDLYGRGFDAVVLDLHDVSFIDSSGLRLLLRLQQLALAEPQRTFHLADCSEPVRRLLELTRLAGRFPTTSGGGGTKQRLDRLLPPRRPFGAASRDCMS